MIDKKVYLGSGVPSVINPNEKKETLIKNDPLTLELFGCLVMNNLELSFVHEGV